MVTSADQGISSASNVMATLLIARLSTQQGFGMFALVAMTYATALGVNRTLWSEPHSVVSVQVVRTRLGRRLVVVLCALAMVASAVIAVGSYLAIGLSFGLAIGWPAGIVMLCLPVLAAQDMLRMVAIAWARATTALVGDLVWLVGLVCVWKISSLSGNLSATVISAGWCAFGALSILVLIYALRAVGQADEAGGSASALARCVAALGWPAGLEYLAITGALQVAFYIAAAQLGPAGVSGPRGVQVLLGPLTVLFLGVSQAILPLLARQRARADGVRQQGIFRVQVTFVFFTACMLGVLELLPSGIGRQILGASWPAAHEVLPAYAVYTALQGISLPALMEIRALQGSRMLFRVRLSIAILTPTAAFVGSRFSATGFAWGLALSQLIDTSIIQRVVRRLRDSEHRLLPPVGALRSTD